MQEALSVIAVCFEGSGFAAFAVSLGFWLVSFRRAKKAGILDYSMFALHPLFLMTAVLAGVLLAAAVRYLRNEELIGFRMTIGAAVMLLSLLVWNTGFVTKTGLFMTGSRCNPLTSRRENGLLVFVPVRQDLRVSKPIVYENTPENREKFASLMQEKAE